MTLRVASLSIMPLWCVIAAHSFAAALNQTIRPLAPNESVEREITIATVHSYSIQLDAGDYAAGWVHQRGITVFVEVFSPDGSLLRGFGGRHEGKREFAFLANVPGAYRLQLRTPTAEEASRSGQVFFFWNLPPQPESGRYELRLTERLSVDERVKPVPRRDRYSSPTIESLRQQIARGETNTEAFWSRVRQSGAPLVEHIEKDGENVLLTFLWRGASQTRNVVVLSPVPARAFTDKLMTHLAGSDVWYMTVRVPDSSRFTTRCLTMIRSRTMGQRQGTAAQPPRLIH